MGSFILRMDREETPKMEQIVVESSKLILKYNKFWNEWKCSINPLTSESG